MENIVEKAFTFSIPKIAKREENEKNNFSILNLFKPKNKLSKYAKIEGKIQHQPNWMYRNE